MQRHSSNGKRGLLHRCISCSILTFCLQHCVCIHLFACSHLLHGTHATSPLQAWNSSEYTGACIQVHDCAVYRCTAVLNRMLLYSTYYNCCQPHDHGSAELGAEDQVMDRVQRGIGNLTAAGFGWPPVSWSWVQTGEMLNWDPDNKPHK